MSTLFTVNENGIKMVFDLAERARLLHFSALPFDPNTLGENADALSRFNLVEVNVSGLDKPLERHGAGFTATAPGYTLRYRHHEDSRNNDGRKLVFTLYDEHTGLDVEVHYQFYTALSLLRSWTQVRNQGQTPLTLEYLSSFVINGIEKEGGANWGDNFTVHIPHNSWTRELQWRQYTFDDLGFMPCIKKGLQRSSKPLHYGNTGAWSSKEFLPMAFLEDNSTGAGLFWQIEHNGSWHWEIGDQADHLYLQLSGPNEFYHHWYKQLQPGDEFCSVPVAIGVTTGGFTDAIATLTQIGRASCRERV